MWRLLLLACLVLAVSSAGGSAGVGAVHVFSENFAWTGTHAAPPGGPDGATVFWPEDSWDTRGDTHSIDLYGSFTDNTGGWTTGCVGNAKALPDGSCPKGKDLPNTKATGFHVDVAKAASKSLADGHESTGAAHPDGTAGVGIMRLDEQGIVSARLRNPLLVSASHPAYVSFRAPLFTTSGTWWEVAIVPTTQPTGGEYTIVPGRSNAGGRPKIEVAPGPDKQADGDNGPGHPDDYSDSINLISFGWPDIPTADRGDGKPWGWHTRFVLSKYVNPDPSSLSRRVIQHVFNPMDGEKTPQSKPADASKLYWWKIVYTPTRIRLFADLNEDGKLEPHGSFAMKVPWKEVYVELLAVAYQADHHPQWCCGYNPKIGVTHSREIPWKFVVVDPVRYSRTYVLPGSDVATLRSAGWLGYDLRDIERYGTAGVNAKPYDYYSSELYCSQLNPGGVVCPSARNCAVSTCGPVTLSFTVTAAQRAKIARIQLLSDVKYPGSVTVSLNGHQEGRFPLVVQRPIPTYCGTNHHTKCDSQWEPDAWVRRGIDLKPADLVDGQNTLRLALESSKQVALDRLQIEVDER